MMTIHRRAAALLLAVAAVAFGLIACGQESTAPADRKVTVQETALKAVATTTLVGDVVKQVAGDSVELTILLPVGADPHGFDPSPADVAAVTDADVVFVNGLGLESFVEPMLVNAGGNARVVTVSDGIQTLAAPHGHGDEEEHSHDDDINAEHEDATQADTHDHEDADPHVWSDPINVTIWAQNIARSLSDLDPAGADTYRVNALSYQQALAELDTWITEQVARIPKQRRKLVTDHAVWGYFAQRYGFDQVGTIIPGYSTLSEPSAEELARLEDAVGELDVPAIFVGKTINPSLAERVAQDTGTRLFFVYTGSLSDPNGDAATYLDYMRANVNAIVEGLK